MTFETWWNNHYPKGLKEGCIHCKEIADIAWRAALREGTQPPPTKPRFNVLDILMDSDVV